MPTVTRSLELNGSGVIVLFFLGIFVLAQTISLTNGLISCDHQNEATR